MSNETNLVENQLAEAPPTEKKTTRRAKTTKTSKTTTRKPRAKKTSSKKNENVNPDVETEIENDAASSTESTAAPVIVTEEPAPNDNIVAKKKTDTTQTSIDEDTVATKNENSDEQNKAQKADVKPEPKHFPSSLPNIVINNIVELAQAPQRSIILTDQQIQQLSLEEIEKRHIFLEQTLARVLDYDVVISDTNIWLELLVGHTSSHSDPRVNARLQFERQLEFISKFMQYRGGRFVMMGETYEEIDRFASLQDPTNHKEADFTDNLVSLNAAARLAKRLILAQQRENRLRIEGISAESHHAAFADPAIIRRVVELFAMGKKVLLLTNDASVAIRSMGLCDDLQHHNNISDEVWDKEYAPLRPMVMTFDDLKLLDFYTRQYYYISMASAMNWMGTIDRKVVRNKPEQLALRLEAFRPGDRRKGDNLNPETITEKNTNSNQQQKQQKQKQKQQKTKQEPKQQKLQQQEQKQQEATKAEQDSQTDVKHATPTETGIADNVAAMSVSQDSNNTSTQEPLKEEQKSNNKTEQKTKQKQRKRPQKSPKTKKEEVKTE